MCGAFGRGWGGGGGGGEGWRRKFVPLFFRLALFVCFFIFLPKTALTGGLRDRFSSYFPSFLGPVLIPASL